MRFNRIELSPANKRQYLLALGVKDIELLLGEAKNALRFMPHTNGLKDDRKRLSGLVRGLQEALQASIDDGDDSERAPLEDRHKYKAHQIENPLLDITRFEVVDHSYSPIVYGSNRLEGGNRTVVFFDGNKEISSSVQDQGRTLKLFIKDREK